MKKIITSVGMLVFVGAMVVAGTGAFFNDTETSTGNVFTAGALDLKVDSVAHINGLVCFEDQWVPESEVVWDPQEGLVLADGADIEGAVQEYNDVNPANVPQAGEDCAGTWELTDLGPTHTFFNYRDLKPGDEGENTISLHVNNNDAYMCAIIDTTEDADNGITEPEGEDGDTSDGAGNGELDSELNFFVWEDDGDNIFEQAETDGVLVNGAVGTSIDGTYPLYTPQTEVFPGGETKYLGVYWCYGDFNVVDTTVTCDGGPVNNISQTDSLKADISFYIEQARNNGDFVCPGREVPPETATVTVDKEVAFTDLAIEGVDVSDFTLTITGPNGAQVVTDNIPTAGLPVGEYTISETYSGVPANVTYGASFSGGCTEVGDTGVGTMNVVAGVNPTCVITNSVSLVQPG